jgi:hypothetical protein
MMWHYFVRQPGISAQVMSSSPSLSKRTCRHLLGFTAGQL